MSTAPPSFSTRRDQERLSRRQAMLAAALAVFAEKGYEQATIDEVAERAQFGKGTLYNYFPAGKESILLALFDELYDGLQGAITEQLARQELSGADTRTRFRELIATLISFFSDNRDAFLLLMKEAQRLMLGHQQELAGLLTQKRDTIVEAIEPVVEEAVAAGHLRAYPPRAIVHVLLGNVQGYLLYAFCTAPCGAGPDPLWPPLDTAAEFLTEILFDGLSPV